MRPPLLALFDKSEIGGDDALLELARARLEAAGLGAEVYPRSPAHLERLLGFVPAGVCTAHLPRHLDLLQAGDREQILGFARNAGGRLYGLNVHEHRSYTARFEAAVAAIRAIDQALGAIPGAPRLFVEFTAGLTTDTFAALFEQTSEAERVSACIDVGHVGIRACADAFFAATGDDAFALEPDSPRLPRVLGAMQEAVAEALPRALELVGRLGRLGKPLHLHLHDGHPLSRSTPYRVSDHLGFLDHVELPFAYEGRRLLGGMYGVAGLRAIVAAARAALPPAKLSCLLEIHARPGRLPLGGHERLFAHWADRTNAERMNQWLETLIENATLFEDAWQLAGQPQR